MIAARRTSSRRVSAAAQLKLPLNNERDSLISTYRQALHERENKTRRQQFYRAILCFYVIACVLAYVAFTILV